MENVKAYNYSKEREQLAKIDLNEFKHYFIEELEKGNRPSIDISLNGQTDVEVRIWVYDYNLSIGQNVKAVKEIDLERTSLEAKRREYEKLKELFENEE